MAHACKFVRTMNKSVSISEGEIPALPSLSLWCLLSVLWSAMLELVHAACGLYPSVAASRVQFPL